VLPAAASARIWRTFRPIEERSVRKSRRSPAKAFPIRSNRIGKTLGPQNCFVSATASHKLRPFRNLPTSAFHPFWRWIGGVGNKNKGNQTKFVAKEMLNSIFKIIGLTKFSGKSGIVTILS
jgi:hypothetical protein